GEWAERIDGAHAREGGGGRTAAADRAAPSPNPCEWRSTMTATVDHQSAARTGARGPQKLGPLTPLVGEWEGDLGVDLSYHNRDDETGRTTYFEKAVFAPIPVQENGRQTLWGLSYTMTAWRHGEEAMDPFHDEVGFLLWDK